MRFYHKVGGTFSESICYLFQLILNYKRSEILLWFVCMYVCMYIWTFIE